MANLAAGFAEQLAEVKSIHSTGAPDEGDAEQVNDRISLVARQADSLITAVIVDAEALGLKQPDLG